MHRSEFAEQLRFAAPIGGAALVQQAGRSIGKIFIGSTLGPTALAYYATGTYLQPLVRVMRSGIEDAVYPELVRAHNQPGGALRLWQRVNVLNCVAFFPACVLLVFYAKQIVVTLFTSAYLPAVPIFSIYAIFLVRRCFNTDVLLRTTGRSGFMLLGTIGALTVNIVLISLLSRTMGMIGPAIAFISAEVVLELYYARQTLRALQLKVTKLADWSSIFRIAASCALAMPLLFAFDLLPGNEFLRMTIAALLYFSAVLWLAYRLGVADVGRVVGYVWSRLIGETVR
jgi:O-antigen/teichoic acid export membrane protein